MSETKFSPGDIVYHKANNLRMVVTGSAENYASCKFVNRTGSFDEKSFLNVEISKLPIKNKDETFAKVLVQLSSTIDQ